MNADEHRLEDANTEMNAITERVIGCAYRVHNSLGCGFLEKVYENALAHELKKNGLHVQQQMPIRVLYDNVTVGDYFADLVVERSVLLELKHVENLNDVMKAQCLNYLRATGLKICLLFNFAKPELEIKRYVYNF